MPLSFPAVLAGNARDGFTIDLDKAIFDDFTYETCEIKLIVNHEREIDSALNTITRFAKTHGMSVKPVEGRLIEYLKRKVPEHYQALQRAANNQKTTNRGPDKLAEINVEADRDSSPDGERRSTHPRSASNVVLFNPNEQFHRLTDRPPFGS